MAEKVNPVKELEELVIKQKKRLGYLELLEDNWINGKGEKEPRTLPETKEEMSQ